MSLSGSGGVVSRPSAKRVGCGHHRPTRAYCKHGWRGCVKRSLSCWLPLQHRRKHAQLDLWRLPFWGFSGQGASPRHAGKCV